MPERTAASAAAAPRRNKHGHRRQPRQMELFASAAAGAPRWTDWPGETRRMASELITRSLQEHADRNDLDVGAFAGSLDAEEQRGPHEGQLHGI